jgi:hypothetical protein
LRVRVKVRARVEVKTHEGESVSRATDSIAHRGVEDERHDETVQSLYESDILECVPPSKWGLRRKAHNDFPKQVSVYGEDTGTP